MKLSLLEVAAALFAVTGIMATSATLSAQDADDGLKTYINKSAGIEAMMPPDPQYNKVQQGEGADDLQHQYLSPASNGVFMIAYQDHPNLDVGNPKIAEAAFVAARDGFQQAVQGERTVYKEIKQGGVNGREMLFTIPAKNGEVRSRMFFANKRWYHVFVLGAPDFVNSKAATTFLDSFRVLDLSTGKRLPSDE